MDDVSESQSSSSSVNVLCRKSLGPKYPQCCFSVKPQDYQILLQMGSACGGTAPIYLGKHTPTDNFVAIRLVPLEDCLYTLEEFLHEIIMHKVLDFENILTYLSTFIADQTLWVVMPLYGFGSCMDTLMAQFTCGLPELAISVILREIIKALEYLHNNGIIHRSVRSSHILISSSGQVVLTGLRNSYNTETCGRKLRKVHEFSVSSSKVLKFLAPEVLAQDLRGYDETSDIYSLAIVACEMANGCTPFSDLEPAVILYEKLQGNSPQLLDSSKKHEENIPDDSPLAQRTFSHAFHDFVAQCCQLEPSRRPSATALLRHPFITCSRKVRCGDLPAMLDPLKPLSDAVLNDRDIGSHDLNNLTNKIADAKLTEPSHWIF